MEIIIKLDHDDKVKTASIYGEQHPDPNDEITAEQLISRIKSKEDKIQDLKLENDRLKQREELMLHFIRSVACEFSCKECDIRGDRNLCHYLTSSDSKSTGTRMRESAKKLLSRLEDL